MHFYAGDLVTAVILDPPPHQATLLFGKLDILDRPTTITDEMKMPVPVCLVHVEGTPETEAVSHTLIDEDIEITIYVTQTERGKLAPKLVIHPIGGHMDVP